MKYLAQRGAGLKYLGQRRGGNEMKALEYLGQGSVKGVGVPGTGRVEYLGPSSQVLQAPAHPPPLPRYSNPLYLLFFSPAPCRRYSNPPDLEYPLPPPPSPLCPRSPRRGKGLEYPGQGEE